MPNLKAHAAAIQAAIDAARMDGCYLDDGGGNLIGRVELYETEDGALTGWVEIHAEDHLNA